MDSTFFASLAELPVYSGFDIFSRAHLLWLAAIAALAIVCAPFYRRGDAMHRRRLSRAVCWAMVATAWLRFLLLHLTGQYDAGFLPLHLCGISVYLCLWNSYCPTPFKQEICYSLTLPGAMLALLFPNWTAYPCWNFITISSFIIHAGLVIYPVLLLAGGELRPDYKRLPQCFLWLLTISAVVFVFNYLFDTNFMFLRHPAPHSPLSWFAQYLGNPGYLLGALLILFLVWLLLYIVPLLCRQKE